MTSGRISELPGHLRADTIFDLVIARAEATPDDTLVIDERRRTVSFREFRESVERVSAGLAERGVTAGTVVSWQLPSWIETMVLTMALSRIGAVQNPLIMMLREPEVEFICRQVGSRLLIVPEEFRGYAHGKMARSVAARLPGIDVLVTDRTLPRAEPRTEQPPPKPTDVRWVFYTSGTTSQPKGARHVDTGLLAAAETFCEAVAPGPDDRIAALAPIAHVGGVLHLLVALMSGAALITTDVFEPEATARLLADTGVTLGGNGTPFAQALLRQQRARDGRLFPDLRAFLIGGAPRPVALHREVSSELGGVGLVSGYGLTECPFIAWGSPSGSPNEIAVTEGRPGPGTFIRIVGADGAEVAAGERGELRVKARQLTVGYVDAALDVEAFDDDGYFRTGDLAFLDDEGCLNIVGRLKDVIIRNMENISAREVEDHLVTVPGLIDSTIIGLPDPETGERVCAVVVPEGSAVAPSLADVCEHLVVRGLNKRKLPVQLEVLDQLPRNAMGKVVKKDLARLFGKDAQ
ncbi:AMP-binding protein [Rhodococcus opacus]|uniref:Putative acid--CoA ligase n=1 Tax=Rhodococcus opacus (strain B4) TaxID=632772 RepID=C1B5T2_RHOOB|nr:AMP-binding protein [Rhodococcus opacus]BAH55343.1 putative acid--CoA ligase [Rhodococcus opacus B4]